MKARLDLEAMKKQAEGVNKEYDNLLKEHEQVTNRLRKLENENGGGKKDD